jgi:large subunit ribosomal protein L10
LSIREEKTAVIANIKEKLEASKAAILTDYRGMSVAEATALRRKLREAKIEYRILKNTLTFLAAEEIGYGELEEYLRGPTAIAFGYEDPVVVAKALTDFTKESKHMTIKAGLVEGSIVSPEGVKALADLPSRETLLAMVLSGIQAPLSGWVSVLGAPLRSFAYALGAMQKQQEA